MPTLYYRTEDPIENIRIRVVVREIAKPKIYNEDGSKIQAFYNEMTLSWQQKLYSPREISDFLRHKDSRSLTAAQVEARRHFAKLEKDGESVKDMLEEVMLYTYVDKDNFLQEKPPPLFDPGTQEPYLGAAVRTLGGVQTLDAREKAISQRLFRDKPFKSMCICLATDVEGQKLSEPASMWTQDKHFLEHVLCNIKLYQDGLLEVSPAFSSVIEEGGFLTHDECSGLGVFIDDHSAETGIKRGFRLASFRVRSAKGSEFEYIIQNVNDILVPYKLEQIEAKKAYINSIRAADVKGNADVWMQDPPSRDKTVGIYAEVVSGRGFEGEKLFLSYEITTPHNWLLRTGDLSDGVGNTTADGKSKDAASAEQQELKNMGRKVRTEGDEGMLHGVTHTATASQPLRTATTLPFHRPRWKGMHLSFAAGTTTRIVFGTAFFLITCFAVIVGASYPFWIVPALVIVFVLGTGVPGPPPQVVLLKRKAKKAASNSSSQYSTQPSQLEFSNHDREVVGDLEPPLVAVFNHLMRFSFDVNDADPSLGSAPSAHMPTMVFQVFSTDWLGRNKLEGYGYHHLSDKPGSCDLEVKTWRPVGKIRDQMVDFFLGNAVYLKDDHFVDSVNKTAAALNRFGVLTQSSGSVRLRVHTIVTDPRTIEDHHRETAEVKQQLDSSMKVKRTVNDILKSFRASGSGTPSGRLLSANSSASNLAGIASLSMSTSAFTPGKPQLSEKKPSVANIMSSLNTAARDAKVTDILARARAKTGKGGVGGAKPEGIAAGGPPLRGAHAVSLGPPTTAAMDRLKMQLPGSNFGTPAQPGAGAVGRPKPTPSTPGAMNAASSVDTPFANDAKQSYDPFIERPQGGEKEVNRPKKVPPLGGLGARAEGKPALAPIITTSAGNTDRSGTSSAVPSARDSVNSGRSSAHNTGRGGKNPSAEFHYSEEKGQPVAIQPQPSAEPTSGRKIHRYDQQAPSEDEAEASEALLGASAGIAVAAQRSSLDVGSPAESGIAASGSSDARPMFMDEEEESPEDAPLLATLQP